jgi:hypothetical protein
LLENGKIAMIVEAVPNLDLIQMLKIDWDMLPIPSINKKSPLYSKAYSGGISISSRCKYPEKAWHFLKWLVFESAMFTPNPMLKGTEFVNKYMEKFPGLKNSNFKIVWELADKYDGGDCRDFVRYSSWSALTILEQMAPALENVLRGKEELSKYLLMVDNVNSLAVKKVKEYLKNPAIKNEFRSKIEEELQKINK